MVLHTTATYHRGYLNICRIKTYFMVGLLYHTILSYVHNCRNLTVTGGHIGFTLLFSGFRIHAHVHTVVIPSSHSFHNCCENIIIVSVQLSLMNLLCTCTLQSAHSLSQVQRPLCHSVSSVERSLSSLSGLGSTTSAPMETKCSIWSS